MQDSINKKYESFVRVIHAECTGLNILFVHRYANKLVPGIGLALAFYDMLTCGEGKIKWGDGLVWHKSEQSTPILTALQLAVN